MINFNVGPRTNTDDEGHSLKRINELKHTILCSFSRIESEKISLKEFHMNVLLNEALGEGGKESGSISFI